MIFDILLKTFICPKPLRIRFVKIDAFIKIYNGIEYLVLFDYWRHDKFLDNIKYFINEKSGVADSVNHNFGRIRIDSYDSLPIEKKHWLFIML